MTVKIKARILYALAVVLVVGLILPTSIACEDEDCKKYEDYDEFNECQKRNKEKQDSRLKCGALVLSRGKKTK